MTEILACWVGATDLRAATGSYEVGMGPIAQAAMFRQYDEIALVSNYEEKRVKPFVIWLQQKTSARISIHYVSLSSPTNFDEIYQAASQIVSEKLREYGSSANLTFHLSPGTPAMAAVWIILAKTRFPAEIIESSKDHGVRTVSVPFDISAEYIPDLLSRSDSLLKRLAAALPPETPEFSDIIHRSEIMQRVIIKARFAAPHSIPVLLEGESGTGKEMLARAIHKASPRSDKPFIAINCGAIPSELVESELFGNEKGAFTGATSTRKGYFEESAGGLLFLDEISEMPKPAQVKMLRVLQEGEVVRVGAAKPIKVDIRVIASTNRNLIEEISCGSFREDLFYRLAVAVIKLPPLRERPGDIGLLIDKLLVKLNEEISKKGGAIHKNISTRARNLMIQYSWPGNIRELINTLTRALVWSTGDTIDEEDLRDALLPVPIQASSAGEILGRSLENGINLPELMSEVAVHYLKRGLEKTHDNKSNTAKLLGLPSYQTLSNWLKKYGLE